MEVCTHVDQIKSVEPWTPQGCEEIQRLAYRLWEERGKKPGSPDDDWFRAEEILREAGSPESLPFSSVEVEPIEQ